MKRLIPIILLTCNLLTSFAQTNFLNEQKKYSRVRAAINDKEQMITDKIKSAGINMSELNILILAFKHEREVELYVKKKTNSSYKKLTTYDICANSGELGPKRKQGDYQVPEGFYYIDRYNPASNFHLSLGINYPNRSDRKKSDATRLGGDIFIHGSCVTIGCIPMTDDKIKEIYLYAIHAKNNEQDRIPFYIFPFRMTDQNYSDFTKEYGSRKELLAFWSNIKIGYEKFEQNKKELTITVDNKGNYKIQ